MITYPKIETIYERATDGTKALIPGQWRSPAVEMCKDIEWIWTEKVDGTNVRICWDGHNVDIRGRTDAAQFQSDLLRKLQEPFCGETNAQIFEQTFGEKEAILFGEGYGPKIQAGGGLYADEPNIILFDVWVSGVFLDFDAVQVIAKTFGLQRVPVVGRGTLQEGVTFVKHGFKSQINVKHPPEGIVCRLPIDLYDKIGRRLIVKIKARDFKEE